MPLTYILLGAGAVIIAWFIATYNGFVKLTQRAKEAWADIDVQLKRRLDLIPNLVETVKGYATHERDALEAVVTARSHAMAAGATPHEQAQVDNEITGALRQLFALAEAYPDLKANQGFVSLQEELANTESRIAYARQFYGDAVEAYNNAIQAIPGVLVAKLFGFGEREYFEAEVAAREVPKVQF